MAPAAAHKCYVLHTRSAEHKCSAYTPFALHVLPHFTPRGTSSSCCAAVSVLVGVTTALRLTLPAFLRTFFGKQQNGQCTSRNKTRHIQKRNVRWQVTTEKINKLGNVNYVYKSTGIPKITGGIWGSSVSIGIRLRNRRCRVRILLPSRDFHLLVMVLPSRSHVTFPSLVFLHLLLKKKSQFVVTTGTSVTCAVWAGRT